jgi:proteasome assembly chaperone (PAC2) family protein
VDKQSQTQLRNPVLLVAFEGWNDAGNAASSALDHLTDVWDALLHSEIDPEPYYDFQVNRPYVTTLETGERFIEWPSTTVHIARHPKGEHDVVLIRGIEPNLRWRSYANEVLSIAKELGVVKLVAIGALLSEISHNRPIPVIATSNNEKFLEDKVFSESDYTGPTGIIGVIVDLFGRNEIPAASLWAQVPHYVAGTNCPKATLALLSSIEELLDVAVELEDLTEAAAEWEKEVDALAADDEELATYISQLEDTQDPSPANGSIADEFERYLRRRHQ